MPRIASNRSAYLCFPIMCSSSPGLVDLYDLFILLEHSQREEDCSACEYDAGSMAQEGRTHRCASTRSSIRLEQRCRRDMSANGELHIDQTRTRRRPHFGRWRTRAPTSPRPRNDHMHACFGIVVTLLVIAYRCGARFGSGTWPRAIVYACSHYRPPSV
jgi:hypothetical protein